MKMKEVLWDFNKNRNMDKSVRGITLLVGEGDFSFTVAMVKRFPVTADCQFASTSIETAESIMKHKNAGENMELLRKRGVQLYLQVDATCLHDHQILKDEKFARIIFNFPHSGGKSNHKRNRKLLNDFFASAVKVLEEKGQILVTLCKGQGGTPSDQPMRAWHDSWQVVSMAANSSLILIEAVPFQVEDYERYTSTGYRSLDKGFHTDSAITHVFEKADPVMIPGSVKHGIIAIRDEIYTCPRYVYNKLQVVREIEECENHPFKLVEQHLTSMFRKEEYFSQGTPNHISDHFACSLLNSLTIEPGICEGSVSQNHYRLELSDDSEKLNKHYQLEKHKNDNVVSSFTKVSDNLNLETLIYEYDCNNGNLFLRTSLLENFRVSEIPSEKLLFIDSGPVFRPCIIQNCIIQNDPLPLQFHMLVLWQMPGPRNSSGVKGKEKESGTSETKTDEISGTENETEDVEIRADCQVKPECLLGNPVTISYMVQKVKQILQSFLGELYNIKFQKDESGSRNEVLYVVNDLKQSYIRIGNFIVLFDGAAIENIILGELFHVNHCAASQQKCSNCIALVLYLDELASLKFEMKDKRLLYSSDKRVKEQFQKFDTSDDCLKDCKVNIPSLYPMTFVHDMSFWENDSMEFDEIEFCNIIRNVADDVVMKVELLDRYKDPVTERHSRCYRMTFQSPDKALCYDTSWKLQSLIRLEVEKQMKITLR